MSKDRYSFDGRRELVKIAVHLDDFHTDKTLIGGLFAAKMANPNLCLTLFCIAGRCNIETLQKLKSESWEMNSELWLRFAVHGWDHFWEHRWDYWQMRHFLERLEDLNFYDHLFKMPWYRTPRLGALKALAEYDYVLATPWRYQAWLAKLMGVPTYSIRENDLLLHPSEVPAQLNYLFNNLDGREYVMVSY